MISVFIPKGDKQDIKHWKWRSGRPIDDPVVVQPPRPGCPTVRSSLLPAIILSPKDRDVTQFKLSLSNGGEVSDKHVESLQTFMVALRGKVNDNFSTEKSLCKEPLCVFIHFGGPDYTKTNELLGKIWKRWQQLDAKKANVFLCFAITRGGVGGINQHWQEAGDGIDGNSLILPDDEDGVLPVLKEGCSRWGVPLPEPFTKSDSSKGAQSTTVNPKVDESSREKIEEPHANNPSLRTYVGKNPSSSGDEKVALSKTEELFPQMDKWFEFVLKVLVILELSCGFFMSCIKCCKAHSFATELLFASLGLVCLGIAIGVLSMLHTKESSSSDTQKKQ